MLCIAIGDAVTRLALASFTLAWTHSVEKVEWQEDWRLEGERLILVETRMKGTGAGMEPAADATLQDGWYVSHPQRSLPELRLARSGGIADWRLCTPARCQPGGPGSAASATYTSARWLGYP